jgi:hypothetical protein
MSTNYDSMLRSHQVVVDEVRERHPELPDKLFRWASGHQHWEFGLAYLSDGHVLTGSRLLLRALVEDPRAALQLGMRRIFARLWRSSGFDELARSRFHSGAASRVVKRNFLEADPTILCGRPRAPWTRKRLAYITGLLVERPADVPSDGDHCSANDTQAHACRSDTLRAR